MNKAKGRSDPCNRATASHVYRCWQAIQETGLLKSKGICSWFSLAWRLILNHLPMNFPNWHTQHLYFQLRLRAIQLRSLGVHRSSHGAWVDSEHFKWRCLHPWCYKYRYRATGKVDAPREVLWRSHWAENPESRCIKRLGVARGCSDTKWIRVACGTGSDCHLQTKRSWSCNKRRCPYRGILPGEHPPDCDEGWRQGLPILPSTG